MVALAPIALRFVEDGWADRVPALANDSMTAVERDEILAENPDSFLHVTRSAAELLPGQAATGWTIHEGSRIALRRLLSLGAFGGLREPALYIVRLRFDGHEQLGVLGGISLGDDHENDIRAHENVHHERVADLAEHLGFVGAESSPVALGHQPSDEVAMLLRAVVDEQAPVLTMGMDDGYEQSLWTIDDAECSQRLVGLLTPAVGYIIDGHHRVAAAREIRRRGVRSRSALGLAAVFALDELDNRAYHRVLLPPIEADEFFTSLDERFSTTTIDSEASSEVGPDDVTFYARGVWRRMTLPPLPADDHDPLHHLDATRLQRHVFGPICGIDEADPVGHLEFVPGTRPIDELADAVDERGGVLCMTRPVAMTDLVSVADAGLSMPPKSTFFVPKLRAGIVLHTLEGVGEHIPGPAAP